MKIEIQCPNGHKLKLDRKYAGRTIRCPKCESPTVVGEVSERPAPRRSGPKIPSRSKKAREKKPVAAQPEISNSETKQADSQTPGWIKWLGGAGLALGTVSTLLIPWLLLNPPQAVAVASSTAAASADSAAPPQRSQPVKTPPARQASQEPERNDEAYAAAMQGGQAQEAERLAAEQRAKEEAYNQAAENAQATEYSDIAESRAGHFVKSRDAIAAGQTWTLPHLPGASAFDPVSGNLFISWSQKRGITALSLQDMVDGKKPTPRQITTEATPGRLCVKTWNNQSLLIVAARESATVQTYDTKTLAQVGEPVDLGFDEATGVLDLSASTDPEDPFVYFTTQKKQAGRFSMATREIESVLGNLRASRIIVSPKGDVFYTWPGPNSFVWNAPVGGTMAFADIRYRGPATLTGRVSDMVAARLGTIVPYPDGHTVAIGEFSWSRQLVSSGSSRRSQGYFATRTLAAFQEHPLTIDISTAMRNKMELGIRSTNDRQRIAAVELPPSWGLKSEVHVTSDYLAAIPDDRRQNVALITSNRLFAASFADLKVPVAGEKRLQLAALPPHTVYVGSEIEVPLVTNPNTKIELLPDLIPNEREHGGEIKQGSQKVRDTSLLGGAAPNPTENPNEPFIKDGVFRWTPGIAQSGNRSVVLKTTEGMISREWVWDFKVALADSADKVEGNLVAQSAPTGKFSAPFYITGFELTQDLSKALVWGRSMPDDEHPVVDYMSSMPQASNQLQEGVKFYVGLLDLKTNETIATHEVDVPVFDGSSGPHGHYIVERRMYKRLREPVPTRLIRLDPETLEPGKSVILRSHSGVTAVLDREVTSGSLSLEPKTLKLITTDKVGFDSANGSYLSRAGWVIDGVLWDDSIKQPKLIVEPRFFGGEYGSGNGVANSTVVSSPEKLQVSSRGPISLVLGPEDKNYNPTRTRQKKQPIYYELPVSGESRFTKPELAHVYGDTICALTRGRLFLIPAAAVKFPTAADRIKREQSQLVLDAAKPNKVTYSGPDSCSYKLSITATGVAGDFADYGKVVDLESKDGNFVIDFRELQGKLEYCARNFVSNSPGKRDKKERLDNFLEAASVNFKKVVGRKPKGIPFAVRAIVGAYRNGKLIDHLEHIYLVELPISKVRL